MILADCQTEAAVGSGTGADDSPAGTYGQGAYTGMLPGSTVQGLQASAAGGPPGFAPTVQGGAGGGSLLALGLLAAFLYFASE